MRIVIVQPFELPSRMAHAVQVLSTAQALAERGHEVVLSPRVRRGVDVPAEARALLGRPLSPQLELEPVSFHHKGLAGLDLRRRLVLECLRSRGRTIFYARHLKLALALRALARAAGRRPRLVFEFHNLEHVLAREQDQGAGRVRELEARERRVAQAADGLVAISRPLADDVERGFSPAARVAVVPDGVDLARFQGPAPAPRADGESRLIYAGSLFRHKGVDSLLDAMERLPARVTLTVAGGHPADELARLQARAEATPLLRGRVHWLGHLPGGEVARALRASDVVLLPASPESRSQRYTSPLKLFEALASGVPIVAAPASSLASILTAGETAFLARSSSGADLARCVEEVLADPARARAVGARARTLAEEYGWDRRAERIEGFLRELYPE